MNLSWVNPDKLKPPVDKSTKFNESRGLSVRVLLWVQIPTAKKGKAYFGYYDHRDRNWIAEGAGDYPDNSGAVKGWIDTAKIQFDGSNLTS